MTNTTPLSALCLLSSAALARTVNRLLPAAGLLLVLPILAGQARAQDPPDAKQEDAARPEAGSADGTADSRYYDFWPGTWYRIVDGVVDTTSTRFRVERGVHPAAFEEKWRLVIDSATTITARASRAWDSASGRWRYVWLSDAGQFQVWEGRKVDGHWYMFKEFDIEGRRVLSRQAWIPIAPGRLERISEHSSDGGRTWQRRFREEYARVSNREWTPCHEHHQRSP